MANRKWKMSKRRLFCHLPLHIQAGLFQRLQDGGIDTPRPEAAGMITNDGAAAGNATGAPRVPLYARAYPAELKAAELACIKRRRAAAQSSGYAPCDPVVPAVAAEAGTADLSLDTVGLALSGGGIRSATFCLGFLQALASQGLLRRVDFLSTVSGGGYIGAFLGGLIQRQHPIESNGPTGIGRAERDLCDPRPRCRCSGCASTAGTCRPTAPATRSSRLPCISATCARFTSCWRRWYWRCSPRPRCCARRSRRGSDYRPLTACCPGARTSSWRSPSSRCCRFRSAGGTGSFSATRTGSSPTGWRRRPPS